MDKAYMARREGTTAHQLLQLADQNLGAVKANLFHLAALPVFRLKIDDRHGGAVSGRLQ